jgi:hypothetical protein
MPEDFARKIGLDVVDLQIAVANLQAVDVKDFFPRLEVSIGKNIQHLYQAATDIWLHTSDNRKAAEKLVDEIRKHSLF